MWISSRAVVEEGKVYNQCINISNKKCQQCYFHPNFRRFRPSVDRSKLRKKTESAFNPARWDFAFVKKIRFFETLQTCSVRLSPTFHQNHPIWNFADLFIRIIKFEILQTCVKVPVEASQARGNYRGSNNGEEVVFWYHCDFSNWWLMVPPIVNYFQGGWKVCCICIMQYKY